MLGRRLGLLPVNAITRAADSWFTVERGVVAGVVVFAAGQGTNL